MMRRIAVVGDELETGDTSLHTQGRHSRLATLPIRLR